MGLLLPFAFLSSNPYAPESRFATLAPVLPVAYALIPGVLPLAVSRTWAPIFQ